MNQPLILLPGLLCDQTVWQYQIDALSDLAAATVTDWAGLDSLALMAEAVLRMAPDRFSLAGHSMGARVALEVFRRAPGRVTRLALFNTGCHALPEGPKGEEETRGRHALLEIARSQGIRAMAARWLPPMLHPDRAGDAALVEAITAMLERKTPQIFEEQIRALLGRPEASGLLPQIRCPTLLLTGREDSWSPPAIHEQMAAAIPASTLSIVENCGHMSTMEQPQQVARALSAWLNAEPVA
jgi:pimeloyl-ACP methyl ester carboxylesterase